LILLDDAFQHRQTKAGFQLVLTTFNSPFYLDYMLPVGNLRESRNGVRRADVIIVTKCPEHIEDETKKLIRYSMSKYQKPIFFSRIIYGELVSFTFKIPEVKNMLLVTGIAETTDLINYLQKDFLVDHMAFPDHHEYTFGDIEKIHRKFDTFASSDKVIVTTFKDYMRLKRNLVSWGLDLFPWYFLPISVKIENETEFIKLIQNYVGKN
jgi:tetraacyldisaccharide 4'-kinase